MKLNRAFVGAAFILISLRAAHAQSSAIQQLQNMQQQQLQMPQPELRAGTNAPELYEGENADIGPQRILRVGSAQQAPSRNYFDATFDTQIFYSDNANYSFAGSRISSWVFVNTVQAAIAPDAYDMGPGKFAPALGISSQWYNYTDGRMVPLNFDSQTAFANLRYLLGNWQFLLGANYTRLVNQPNYSIETYHEWLPNFSVQRAIPLSDTVALVVGDAVDYHFTWVPPGMAARTDINDHFDDTLYFTLNWQVTSHFVVQPSYRFQYSDYQFDTLGTSKRYDYLNAFGLNLLYNFNQHVSLRTFFNYTTKTSSDPFTPAYDELNGGVGATLDVRF